MTRFALLFLMITFFSVISSAQHGRRGHFNPDSLSSVEKSGTVIVDTSARNHHYYLDVNNDGVFDYILNFGPPWYMPDSSDAVKPGNGELVTVSGGLKEHNDGGLAVIIVYEINGEFWRDPYDSYWNRMGRFAKRHNRCGGNGFGWMHDSVQVVKTAGIVLTDTTLYHVMFYMDINSDTIPDYFLNFGPSWYKPKNAVELPLSGDSIEVEACLINRRDIPVLIVYKINGEVWRDSSFAEHFGGGWFNKNMRDSRRFRALFDSSDFVEMRAGWKMGNMGGMVDSIFCELFEVLPGSLPLYYGHHEFAGYELNMYESGGINRMHNNNSCGGRMRFNSQAKVQLHYEDEQIVGDESSIIAKYWDESSLTWQAVENVALNKSENTVTFSASELNNYYILSSSSAAGVKADDVVPSEFSLGQNYPNPFNPTTTFTFSVPSAADVTIRVYDITGKLIETLINNQHYLEGNYNITWNASSSVSSGIYFLKMDTGSFSGTIKAALVR